MDECRLILGDCLDVLKTLESGSVDALVTDPPYGVNFQGKNTKHTQRRGQGYATGVDDPTIGPRVIAECVNRFGRAACFVETKHAFDYPKPVEIGSVFCPSGAGLGSWGFILTHPILYYGRDPYLASGKGHRPNSFRSFATQEPNGHPCPKPLEWMRWLVKKVSLPGETILDPFMGSGTTAVACLQTGRKFIGIEIDPAYYAIAEKRIAAERDRFPLFDKVAEQPDLFAET